MLEILFSANKAVTKSSDMEHNYSWLSEGLRNSMCSEPQLWHWICWSTDYSFCQAHTSPSACHRTATHQQRTEQCLLGQTTDSCLDCFQLPSTPLGDEGIKPAESSKHWADTEEQEIHRYTGTEDQQKSWLSPLSFSCMVSHLIHFSLLNI